MSNSDRAYRGAMPPITAPVDMRIGEGVIMPDYPNVRHLGFLNSPTAFRAADLAAIHHSLDEAASAFALLGSIKSTSAMMDEAPADAPLLRALATAATTAYCRCFSEKTTASHLSAADVFEGVPEALRSHEYLVELRNKHHAHDVNDRRQSTVAGAFDADGALVTLSKYQTLTDESAELARVGSLLIAHVRKQVDAEIVQVDGALRAQFEALTPEERLKLPPPTYNPALYNTVETHRRNRTPKRPKAAKTMSRKQATEVAALINSQNQLQGAYDAENVLATVGEYLLELSEAGDLVGCAELKKVQWYQYEVDHVSVSPGVVRQGVGGRLVARAEAKARQMGGRVLQCTIREGNLPSEGLFAKMEFLLTGGFYNAATKNNVGIWAKALSPKR